MRQRPHVHASAPPRSASAEPRAAHAAHTSTRGGRPGKRSAAARYCHSRRLYSSKSSSNSRSRGSRPRAAQRRRSHLRRAFADCEALQRAPRTPAGGALSQRRCRPVLQDQGMSALAARAPPPAAPRRGAARRRRHQCVPAAVAPARRAGCAAPGSAGRAAMGAQARRQMRLLAGARPRELASPREHKRRGAAVREAQHRRSLADSLDTISAPASGGSCPCCGGAGGAAPPARGGACGAPPHGHSGEGPQGASPAPSSASADA